MKAALLISHGSRSQKTIDEIKILIGKLKSKSDFKFIDFAFLELQSPSIPEGIKACVEKGATEILILLNFLNAGRHIDEDIPEIIKEAKEEYSKVEFSIANPIGQHAKIPDLFIDIIKNS
jgi:sirohydrochlorin ferrochelatase